MSRVTISLFAVVTLRGLGVCQSLQQPAGPVFEAVSIKPSSGSYPGSPFHGFGPPRISASRIEFGDTALAALIGWAYRITSERIAGPGWLRDVRFDVVATFPEGTSEKQSQDMTMSMLTDRFHLVAHRSEKPIAVYTLKVAPAGAILKESDPKDSTRPGCTTGRCDGFSCRKMTIEQLARRMSMATWQRMSGLDLPVVDSTGLKGTYDFDLPVVWEAGPAGALPLPGDCVASSGSVFRAVRSLGLVLEQGKQMQEIIVVDSVMRNPIPN